MTRHGTNGDDVSAVAFPMTSKMTKTIAKTTGQFCSGCLPRISEKSRTKGSMKSWRSCCYWLLTWLLLWPHRMHSCNLLWWIMSMLIVVTRVTNVVSQCCSQWQLPWWRSSCVCLCWTSSIVYIASTSDAILVTIVSVFHFPDVDTVSLYCALSVCVEPLSLCWTSGNVYVCVEPLALSILRQPVMQFWLQLFLCSIFQTLTQFPFIVHCLCVLNPCHSVVNLWHMQFW